MFSLFAKIIKKLATYPKIILTVFLAIGILSIYPIMHLRWDLQLQDTITSAREPSNVQQIEDAFGGLGSLIVILQSGDSRNSPHPKAPSNFRQCGYLLP